MKPMAILLVALGGALGAVARFVVGNVVAKRFGTSWPWGTFLINVTGCFAIGFFLTLASERVVVDDRWRYLFPIGFVGAYTTFSTYEYDTFRLVEEGAWARALSYVVLSTLVGFASVWSAVWMARRI